MSTDIDWAAVDAFKASAPYLALGVLGRERALYAEFPEVEARHKALTARHMEGAVWDMKPVTLNPDEEETS